MLEKLSLPGPSAGRGAFLIAGYDVVLTPHSSNFSKVGVGAFGVSMNSNSLSEPLVLWGLEDMIAVFPID